MAEQIEQEFVVPACSFQFFRERTFARVAARDVEGAAADDGDVGGSIVAAIARRVLAKSDVEFPMQTVFDLPVCAHCRQQIIRRQHA